jgi:hypothetical protein
MEKAISFLLGSAISSYIGIGSEREVGGKVRYGVIVQ